MTHLNNIHSERLAHPPVKRLLPSADVPPTDVPTSPIDSALFSARITAGPDVESSPIVESSFPIVDLGEGASKLSPQPAEHSTDVHMITTSPSAFEMSLGASGAHSPSFPHVYEHSFAEGTSESCPRPIGGAHATSDALLAFEMTPRAPITHNLSSPRVHEPSHEEATSIPHPVPTEHPTGANMTSFAPPTLETTPGTSVSYTSTFPYVYEPSYADPEILYDDFLQENNLAIHITAKCILCRECGYGLDTRYVTSHLEGKHPELRSKGRRKEIREIISSNYAHMIHPEIPGMFKPPILPATPLSHVSIDVGFVCIARKGEEECHYGAHTEEAVRRHIQTKHKGDSSYIPKPSLIQTLYPATFRLFFPVYILDDIPAGSASYYRAFVNRRKAMEACAPICNALEIHQAPFFRKYRWYFVIQDIDRQTMVHLIDKAPQACRSYENRLRDTVRLFMQDINKFLGDGELHSELARRLATKNEEDSSSWDFSYQQDYASYAGVLVRCVFALVRHIDWHFSREDEALPPTQFVFYLTARQLQFGFDLIEKAEEGTDDDLMFCLHQFLYSILSETHPMVKADSYCCTLTRCIMLLQMKKDLFFKDPKYFSHDIAALQWCMRAIMLKEILLRGGRCSPPDYVKPCGDVMSECLHDVPVPPYSELQKWLKITHAIAHKALGDNKLMWARDGITLIYRDCHISIPRLGEVFQVLTQQVERNLEERLFFGYHVSINIPPVVYDDLSNCQAGYSWVSEPKNAHWVDEFKNDYFMRNIVLAHPEVAVKLCDPADTITPGIRKWLQDLKEFKVACGVLFKLACSSSIRDTEQLSIIVKESQFGHRNLIFLQDELVLIPEYDKMSYTRTVSEMIPHAVYDRLMRVYVKYLLILFPYESVLRYRMSEDKEMWAKTKDMFFADHKGPFSPTVLSELIKDIMLEQFGTRLGTRDLRHIIHAIGIHTAPPAIMTRGYKNFVIMNAHHTEATGNKIYGRSLSSFGALDPQESVQHLYVSRHFHQLWELGPGNQPPVFTDAPVCSHLTPQRWQSSGPVDLSEETQDHLVEKMRKLLIEVQAGGRLADQAEQHGVRANNCSHPLPSLDGLLLLRRFLKNPSARFRSPEQCTALGMLLEPVQSGLFVLPTGLGKSFLFMLVAWGLAQDSPGNSFIVVLVPYVELLRDIALRCSNHGVLSTTLDFSEASDVLDLVTLTTTSLVLISADKAAKNESIFEFLRMSKLRGKLHCIVLEEVQVLWDPIRPALATLPSKLERVGVPVFLNTGSLTLPEESSLLERFPLSNIRVIRQSTVRPNISYSVYPVKSKIFKASLKKIIEIIRSQPRNNRSTIIFCRTVREVVDLASDLGGVFYHAGMSDIDQRQNSENFRKGNVELLFATTAFGVGVDIPNIRYSIHFGAPYSLTNFVQESGRTGRDGKPSYSMVIYNQEDKFSSAENLKGKDGIYDFLRLSNQCLRGFISNVFDRISCNCFSLPDVNPCEFCETVDAESIKLVPPVLTVGTKRQRDEQTLEEPSALRRRELSPSSMPRVSSINRTTLVTPTASIQASAPPQAQPKCWIPKRPFSNDIINIGQHISQPTECRIEEARWDIAVARQNKSDEQKLVSWRQLRDFMRTHINSCFWCLRNNTKCRKASAFVCAIHCDPAKQDLFIKWRRWLRGLYGAIQSQQHPDPTKLPHNCAGCLMPTKDYHDYTRVTNAKHYECENIDNTVATVWLILQNPMYKSSLARTYPEVDEINSNEFRDWLLKDMKELGDSGMVRILEWYFTAVCKKSLVQQ